MNDRAKVHIAGIALIASVFLLSLLVPASQQSIVRVSSFGFLALLSLIFVVSIPLTLRFSGHPFAARALAQRRWIGIYVFVFSFIHVALVADSFYGWNLALLVESAASFPTAAGFLSLAILLALAVTSNNLSVKSLGVNWKRLQMLVYAAILLALFHFINNGLIFAINSTLVAASILLIAIILILRFAPKRGAPKFFLPP